jgi:cytochrome c-type biogenesis protein CcmH
VRATLALVAALLALAALPAAALARCPKTTLGDVEDEVMCPVCGTPLELATEAPEAQRERALIQRLIDRCQSKAQIKRALAAEFGDAVLATPKGKGFDLTAYLVPAAAVALAAAAIAAAALRWRRRRAAPAAPAAPPPSRAGSSRLESDLERYEL